MKRDPIRGIWVSVAPARKGRPHEGRDRGFVCPFCPGNEALTPPEIERVAEGEGWRVRVVPNKYPILPTHEVIIDSPEHNADLNTLTEGHLNLLVEVWSRRIKAHRDRKYVLLFRNYGHGAGASIVHPHTQLVAMDVVPEVVLKEASALTGEGCLLCGGYGVRVLEYGGYAVTVPEVQTLPYEVWIHPLRHEREFNPQPPFGRLLASVVGVLKGEFGVRDYNLVLHQAPKGYDYHWHLEVLPRMGRFAGFELGTGMRVIHYPPQEFVGRFAGIIATYVKGRT